MPRVCKILRDRKIDFYVYTSQRLLDEELNGLTLKEVLDKEKIEYESSENINDCDTLMKNITDKSIGISFGASWIFKKNMIDKFKGKLLNKHSRDLPKYRGAGGFSWLILNKERESANLLHFIEESIDTGKVVKISRFKFPEECKISLDYEKYSYERDFDFMEEFIDEVIAQKKFQLEIQDELKATFFPRLHTQSHAFIDWSWDREEIINFIRAFDDPYCGASTYCQGKRVYLKKCSTADDEYFHPYVAGIIYRINDKGAFIACRQGGIFAQVLDEQQKPAKIRVGQRLMTPVAKMEAAKEFVAVYTPKGLK